MDCQKLNSPPSRVTAYLMRGSATTLAVEGLPDGTPAQLTFTRKSDDTEPVTHSLETADGVSTVHLDTGQVDALIDAGIDTVQVVVGVGADRQIVAAGHVWVRTGTTGECATRQVVARLVVGPRGEKGEKGERGERGEKGEKGERGLQGEVGGEGPTGPAAQLSIGTVTAGDTAAATVTGEPPSQTLNLVLPRGERGLQGVRGIQGPPGAVPTTQDYLLVGPGRPDQPSSTGGVVTGREPVGCEFRSTDGAGVGAWAWRKRDIGWVVVDGDTGWRKMRHEWFAAPTGVFLRRQAQICEIALGGGAYDEFRPAKPVPAASNQVMWGTGFIPAGFVPSKPQVGVLTDDGRRLIGHIYLGSDGLDNGMTRFSTDVGTGSSQGFTLMRASAFVFMTRQSWPTTLPGTPA